MSDHIHDNVLEIENLSVTFQTMDGPVHAVRHVNLTLERGKTLALVGESGSGKSVTSYAVLRLVQHPGKITGGKIIFRDAGVPGRTGVPPVTSSNGDHDGRDAHPTDAPHPAKPAGPTRAIHRTPYTKPVDIAALKPSDHRLYDIRGGCISMIFQEPMTALSPVHTIGNQVMEAIRLHQPMTKREAWKVAVAMLDRVGITQPEQRMKQYPFEFSGGMRQRVVIAMALVCRPQVLIADEPTTALDVTVQAQILELIAELQKEIGASVLFITHDLGVVAQIADRVAVMQLGRVVEKASASQLFSGPVHPYSKRLLLAIPGIHDEPERVERIKEMQPSEPLPEGYELIETPREMGERGSPKMHRFADGRELLLWPRVREYV